MFKEKKSANEPRTNAIDNLLQKLRSLPSYIDLVLAAVLGGYSFVAIYIDGARVIGIVCLLLALVFAVFGLSTITQEMRAFRILERNSDPETLLGMKTAQFEVYLAALLTLSGYKVQTARKVLHRQDDADLIAVRKKEILLIQFNHWDEDTVGTRPLQSLHKAAAAIQATSAVSITFGQFRPDAIAWAERKEIRLMSMKDILEMASGITGAGKPDIDTPSSSLPQDPDLVTEQRHEFIELSQGHHRFLFVDFAGLDRGLAQLDRLLMDHPGYQVIASTLPPQQSIDDVRTRFGSCGDRLTSLLQPSADGRYYAIQKFLAGTPEGRGAIWLALDAEPRHFPEGCTEVVAINRSWGFDASAAERLREAMLLVDRKAGPTQEYDSVL